MSVIVMGGASEAFVRALSLAANEMRLGVVHDFDASLVFETYPVDPWSGDGVAGKHLEQSAHKVDALVLTDTLSEGTHYSSSALERLLRALQPARVGVPTVVFGGPALAMEWQSLAGVVPAMVAEPTPDNALPIARAVAKAALRALRKSEPPPSVRQSEPPPSIR
jgi:hypothetical protein